MSQQSVLILGAGLQGVCAALALARRGYRSILIDQANDILSRASLRNEGKIHLGLVYAYDTRKRTPGLMLRAAMSFSPLFEEWLGQSIAWENLVSQPFDYAILNNSMLSCNDLYAAYERLQEDYSLLIQNETHLHYLGRKPERLWKLAPQLPRFNLFSSRVDSIVETQELSLVLPRFCQLLKTAINSLPEISVLCGHHIKSVSRTSSGFAVEGIDAIGNTWKHDSELVVNCLWEGRLAIDSQLGFIPPRPWVYRLKYRLLGSLPRELLSLSSVTFVLGAFGDVVVSPQADTYFSWYPACMKGWSQDLSVPFEWQSPCRGIVDRQIANTIANEALFGLNQLVPGIERSQISTIDAGVIFSWGNSDIGDENSELHSRDDIGVEQHDGYFSINTGKLTTAPLFADILAKSLPLATKTSITPIRKVVGK